MLKLIAVQSLSLSMMMLHSKPVSKHSNAKQQLKAESKNQRFCFSKVNFGKKSLLERPTPETPFSNGTSSFAVLRTETILIGFKEAIQAGVPLVAHEKCLLAGKRFIGFYLCSKT